VTVPQTASEEEWYAAYEAVYRALPEDPHVPCPNCGHDALRLVYTGIVSQRIGYVSFWCDNCRYGLHLSHATVPDGVDMLPLGLPPEEHERHVPNYTLVLEDPGATDGDA
jgi:hypothetical protein